MERRGEAEVPVAFLPVRFVVLFDSSSLVASLEGRISTGEREKERKRRKGRGRRRGRRFAITRPTRHDLRPSPPIIDSASLLKVFRTSAALCRDRKYKCGRRSQGNGIAFDCSTCGCSVSANIKTMCREPLSYRSR